MGRSSRSRIPVAHVRLGRAAYRPVHELQRALHTLRRAGACSDAVITVEHDPVFTLGRRGSLGNLLGGKDQANAAGIAVETIERGGDITYHGPGQLVAYPILDLRSYGRSIKTYVASLEETIVRTLDSYGISAERVEGRPGAWIGGKKVASIGVHVSQWITMHGLALNVDINQDHFDMIRPCGLDVGIASLSELVEEPIDVGAVRDRWFEVACEVFGWSAEPGPGAEEAGHED